MKRWEPACKPGSVENGHSSGTPVARRLKRPTRGPRGPRVTATAVCPPICLAPDGVYPAAAVTGDAVRSYRTISPLPPDLAARVGGIFSVALSVGSRLPGVTWHPVLRSPDFPRPRRAATIWPTPKNRNRHEPAAVFLGAKKQPPPTRGRSLITETPTGSAISRPSGLPVGPPWRPIRLSASSGR